MSALITVIVIDRDESVRRAMARLIKAQGLQTICLDSVESLSQQTLAVEGAVLLIDMSTALLSWQLLQELLAVQGEGTPVVYLTDRDTEMVRQRVKQTGAAGYFRKPVDQLALLDAITFAAQ